MIIVVDASTLIAELVRERGRKLFLHPNLRFLVAEEQWEESQRGLARRFDILRSRIGDEKADALRHDADDWPTVALALTVRAAILTSDPDFFGSGVATWTFDTLHAELTADTDVDDPSSAVLIVLVAPWTELLGSDTLPDEACWSTVASRAARETPPWLGNTDRCADCKMLLPMDFSNGGIRRPCPRCVETAEGGGMSRTYARRLYPHPHSTSTLSVQFTGPVSGP